MTDSVLASPQAGRRLTELTGSVSSKVKNLLLVVLVHPVERGTASRSPKRRAIQASTQKSSFPGDVVSFPFRHAAVAGIKFSFSLLLICCITVLRRNHNDGGCHLRQ